MDWFQLARLMTRAAACGGRRLSLVTAEWNVAGDCQSPVTRELVARPSPRHRGAMSEKEAILSPEVLAILRQFPGAEIVRVRTDPPNPKRKHIVVAPGKRHTLGLRLDVRCRKCDNCRRQRRRMWAARAISEWRGSARTWLGTMTLSPTAHALALARARVRLSRQGIDFDGLGLGEQFQERHRAVSRELTLFFKRVRKAAKSPLRVLLVAEAHVSGLPHYHCSCTSA